MQRVRRAVDTDGGEFAERVDETRKARILPGVSATEGSMKIGKGELRGNVGGLKHAERSGPDFDENAGLVRRIVNREEKPNRAMRRFVKRLKRLKREQGTK
jgi:hypothetical protein